MRIDAEPIVRDATQQDVTGINKLFRDEYGKGYPYCIGKLNPNHVNLVAEADGEIVGFAKAAPYGHYDHVWELCSLMVQPGWRGHGIAREFGAVRIARLRSMGVKTLVSEPVTCYENCASQFHLKHFGFEFVGIQPFLHPWIKPELMGEQPLTLALMVVNLNGGTGFGSRRLHMTDMDRAAASLVLESHRLQPPWTDFFGQRMPKMKFVRGKEVHGIQGAEFVDVPLNWRQAKNMADVLRRDGFRFSSVLPGFGRTESGEPYDLLRMYRPPRALVDSNAFKLIHIIPELEALKRFCEDELTS